MLAAATFAVLAAAGIYPADHWDHATKLPVPTNI